MSRLSAASFMEAASEPTERRSLFIYSQVGMEALVEKLAGVFRVSQRGPSTVSFETMQQQEAQTAESQKLQSTVFREELAEERAAGAPPEISQHNKRVFVLSDPHTEEERRALAAISTSLVTSAMNDPSHTVAAFVPVGSPDGVVPNHTIDAYPHMSVLRSLIQRLGVVCFESLSDLEHHLLPA